MCLVIVDNITAYLQISQFYCTLAVLEINTNPITPLRRTLTATANFFFFSNLSLRSRFSFVIVLTVTKKVNDL